MKFWKDSRWIDVNRFLKILAIVVLLITVAGAGAVLYGMTMLEPQVESVTVIATPAVQVQQVFDETMSQVAHGTFAGAQFAGPDALAAQDCTFLTYTVRLANRGFFPAEWIMLEVVPQQDAGGYDVVQLADSRAHVLAANSVGDLSATILRAGDAENTARALRIVCYVFGQRVEVAAQAQ